MGDFVRVYYSNFSDLEEKDSLLRPNNHAEIRVKVKVNFSELPFNILAEEERKNLHYDSLTLHDIWNASIICSDFLMSGGQIFSLSSTEHFGNWVSYSTKCRADSGNANDQRRRRRRGWGSYTIFYRGQTRI